MKGTFGNLCAGAALGLAVGVLAGLAVSPIVGSLLGTLATAGIAFLTLKNSETPPASLARCIGFGVACAAGAIGGIFLRANNMLGLQPARAVAQLKAAGFSDEEARRIYLQQVDAGHKAVAEGKPSPVISGLFRTDEQERDAIQDMLRANPEWPGIRASMKSAYPKWTPTLDAIDRLAIDAGSKRDLLLALVAQP